MKKMFLASSLSNVAADISQRIPTSRRKTAFITTASEVALGDGEWLRNDRDVLRAAGFDTVDYSFTGKTQEEVRSDLCSFDILCVEGGNTYFLAQEIQRSGAAMVIRELIEAGKVYIGSSAGSIVTCPTIGWTGRLDDPDRAPDLVGREGLGLVPFLVFPHWGSPKKIERHLQHNVPLLQKESFPIILLADTHYVEVSDDSFHVHDSSHPKS